MVREESAGGDQRMMDCASWIPSVYTNQHNIAYNSYIIHCTVCGIQSARKVLDCVVLPRTEILKVLYRLAINNRNN